MNDRGRQIESLALSIWLRVVAKTNQVSFVFPAGCYQGAYITDLAEQLSVADYQLTNDALPLAVIIARVVNDRY